MTIEQFNELKQYKPIWEFFFKNFYLTSDHNIHGLAEWLSKNTGYAINMNCSGCKTDLLSYARNIYTDNKHYEQETQPEPKSIRKRKGN
jgi:hypothetical protein